MKDELKRKAISLRRKGLTYSEILNEVSVARSTLSLWLRSVSLSTKHQHRITSKKHASALRGAAVRKAQRIYQTDLLRKNGIREIGGLSKRELWLIGVALYWAEGAKEKINRTNTSVIFSNSDPKMICLVLQWFCEILHVEKERIYFEIYLHESHLYRKKDIKQYWAEQTGYPIAQFGKIYSKKNNNRSNRHRMYSSSYFGQLRIKVKKSTTLTRKIAGWIEGVTTYCGMA